MDEQLYRMGQHGVLEAVQPEGRGRAEAMRTFLARGGGLSKSGRYRSGPMKGKTVQQATTMFEDKWATASGAVKDKYAFRARDVLAPSEKPRTVVKPPKPVLKAPTQYTTRQVGASASAAPAPGSDEARRMAAADIAANERFNTADMNGMSGFAAANAMANQRDMTGDREVIDTTKRVFTAKEAVPGAPPIAKTPAAPVAPPAAAPKMPAAGAPVTNGMPTDERMHAQGKTNAGSTPVVKAPPTPASSGVNSQTKLPFGYRPGDVVAPQFQAKASESVAAQAAAQRTSVAPVRPPTILSQSQINRPRTVSTGVEAAAANEMRRQAGILANPGTVNPPGLTLGKRKPLTELVAARR